MSEISETDADEQPARDVTAPQSTVPALTQSQPEPSEGPSLEQIDAEARRHFAILREHVDRPTPPPDSGRAIDELVWGFAQPLLGLRTLTRKRDLLVRGLLPVAVFILICALVVLGSEAEGLWGSIVAYYGVLVGAASISPVVFCRSYAKLAAEARPHLEVPRREPYLRSYRQAINEAIVQAIVLGIGVAPWAAIVGSVPLLGGLWAAVIGWLWVLHWIVVEALDSARTLGPDDTPESLEQRHATLGPPWYSAAALPEPAGRLAVLLLPVRWWGRLMARLGRRWRGEVALIEERPWLAAGFGLGASLLLVIPVLNLLFRPAVVVAASHVLGRLERESG